MDKDNTTIWAQFKGVNPNEQLVEINVRRTVFYPEKPGMNYITVRGFTLRHAATPWAPPTAEQVGLIGTHWSKGWIIENNVDQPLDLLGHRARKIWRPVGQHVGQHRRGLRQDHRTRPRRTAGTRRPSATTSSATTPSRTANRRASSAAWAPLFSTVTGNTIHDIHVRRLFSGAEMAGIKFHAAIDVEIRGNHIYRTCRGLWLDWMAQGTRVSGNLFHDNAAEDLFVEVDHGPFLVDNNLFLSAVSLLDMSEGGAYVHNLLAGKIISRPEPGRATPYHPAHSTARGRPGATSRAATTGSTTTSWSAEASPPPSRASRPARARRADGFGLWVYDAREFPLQTGGNVYYNGAGPTPRNRNLSCSQGVDPKVKVVEEGRNVYLHLTLGQAVQKANTTLVTTELLGKAKIPGLPYENPDGSPLKIDTDYFGKKRNEASPTAGPFENPGAGPLTLKVWSACASGIESSSWRASGCGPRCCRPENPPSRGGNPGRDR